MNITRIQTTLQALFQDESRWAHPGQRVVFWYDPDQQFQDTFAELQLEDIEKLQLDDTPFTIKYRLLIQQPHLVYDTALYCLGSHLRSNLSGARSGDRSIRAKTSLRHWLSAIRPAAV